MHFLRAMRDHDQIKAVIDWVVAPGTIVASLLGWLPPIAAALSIVWVSLQIYDRLKYGPKK